jgi:hypothetical protein
MTNSRSMPAEIPQDMTYNSYYDGNIHRILPSTLPIGGYSALLHLEMNLPSNNSNHGHGHSILPTALPIEEEPVLLYPEMHLPSNNDDSTALPVRRTGRDGDSAGSSGR